MKTDHTIYHADARSLAPIEDDAIDLVVTSPPYPMIELWDVIFGSLDPEIQTALDAEDGQAAFDRMHDILDAVWAELRRVVAPGGIVCLNVGDATRSIGGTFRRYPNHERITRAMRDVGFHPLPEILWRKPANSAAKFMGSGMLPPNAYVTLEHEHILVFRLGERRSFEPHADRRYEAAYFWEERNAWFTDLWTDVRGTAQALGNNGERDRSGAFPSAIPYRLINMFSVYDDVVLDPFWGTGTTTRMAMASARNSIGIELDEGLIDGFGETIEGLPPQTREIGQERLEAHREFVASEQAAGNSFKYSSTAYDFPVRTRQEEGIVFYEIDRIDQTENAPLRYQVDHRPLETQGQG